MGKAIGIDLGTTNTAVAVMVNGRPRVIEDEKGYKVLPSCVSIKDDGKFVVGQAAKNLVLTRPDRTVYAIKRLMGRRYDSVEATAVRSRVHFNIDPAPDGGCLVTLGNTRYRPVDVSALILQVARSIAERTLGEPVDEAVITVPAYFNHAQREATFEAARLAGLRCERLLNEPTAAALAYGYRKDLERTVLIYDLGGGTFDVSVLRLSGGVYEILATLGDTFLGGEDFDFRLVEHLADHFESQNGIDLRQDRGALQRLKEQAERAKCELSFSDRTTVLVPRITPDRNLELAVSRLMLESMVEDLVEKTLEITRRAVADAGLKLSEVQDVILVGGQTRMPRVREAISALFHKEPGRGVHPEEVVAVGAAVHAGSLSSSDISAPVLLDVTPFDLGIDVAGGLFQPIIMRNTHIPSSQSRVFATVHDNQDAVRVRVRQGTGRLSEENEFLGEFVLSGLTPAPRMQTKVEVTFRIDSNGMLQVSAMEPATGERKRITVRNYAEIAQGEGKIAAVLSGDLAQPGGAEGSEEGGGASAEEKSDKGARSRARRFTSFFERMSRKAQRGDPAPAPAAPSADAHTAAPLAANPTLALPDPLDAETIPEEALEPLTGEDESGEVSSEASDERWQPSDTLAPVTEDLAGLADLPGRIVLPEPAGPESDFNEDLLDELSELDSDLSEDAGRTVAIFGLAGESPSWEAGGAPAPEETPTLMRLAPAAPVDPRQSPWDFGLSIPEPHQSEEQGEFEDLFSAGELEAVTPAPLAPAPVFSASPEQALLTPTPVEPVTPRPTDGDFASPGAVEELFSLDDLFPPEEASVPRPRPVKKPAPQATGGGDASHARRKPARLKLAYPRLDVLITEYQENLRRGGCFVRTERPLPLGRECRIEVRAPGLTDTLELYGVVTWASDGTSPLAPGQVHGMNVEYRLTEEQRRALERVLSGPKK